MNYLRFITALTSGIAEANKMINETTYSFDDALNYPKKIRTLLKVNTDEKQEALKFIEEIDFSSLKSQQLKEKILKYINSVGYNDINTNDVVDTIGTSGTIENDNIDNIVSVNNSDSIDNYDE